MQLKVLLSAEIREDLKCMENGEGREFISGFFESVRFCLCQSLEFQRTESSEQILVTFLLTFKANLMI